MCEILNASIGRDITYLDNQKDLGTGIWDSKITRA